MAWAMHTVGWVEVGQLKKANDHLRRQLTFIKNNFQVSPALPLLDVRFFRFLSHQSFSSFLQKNV